MAALSLRFTVRLGDSISLDAPGPLFFRWIPGEEHAINLSISPQTFLRLWIEQAKEIGPGHQVQHPKTATLDARVWGKVKGGPLRGTLELNSVQDEVLEVIAERKIGDPAYIQFGKFIVNTVLDPRLSRFIKILRINFGQYWIREFIPWDSRRYSLGGYCQSVLALEWSINGTDWERFVPNEPQQTINAGAIGGGRQYLSLANEKDWASLNDLMLFEYTPSDALLLLARAHELFDRRNHRYAFVEGVTALEMAIGELMTKNLGMTLPQEVEGFTNQSVKRQLVAVSATSGLLNAGDLDAALKAITIRNEIVHDGKAYGEEKRNEFMGLLRVVVKIMGSKVFKFPSIDSGNLQMSIGEWEKLEASVMS